MYVLIYYYNYGTKLYYYITSQSQKKWLVKMVQTIKKIN